MGSPTCPTCFSIHRGSKWPTTKTADHYCRDPWHTSSPTPPAPADDASGAEAMREACARACASFKTHYVNANGVRSCMSAGQARAACIAAIRALPLPARPTTATDAVVEAARALVRAAIDARADEAVTGIIVPEAEWDALLAALRGANGGK